VRWGGEHNRPGNDGGCFASALQSLKNYGGVLEHPKGSMAWSEFQLTRPDPFRWNHCPNEGGDAGSAWVCEVWQSAYGHKANKATWLYYIGESKPADLDWSRPRGTHQVGCPDRRGKAANKPTLSKRDANATPIRFRDVLLSLAFNTKDKDADKWRNHD
jgi:hypothetical protein